MQTESRPPDGCMRLILLAISFLNPIPVGVIIGVLYYQKSDEENRQFGRQVLIVSMIPLVLSCVLIICSLFLVGSVPFLIPEPGHNSRSEVPTAQPQRDYCSQSEIAATQPQSITEVSEMVRISAGEFTMGSNGGDSDETPVHTIYLNEYSIDKYETTNAQYAECVTAGKCICRYDYSNAQYANYPVTYVDWTDAKSYCEFAGKRLPTEAEWEKAARGTDGRIYPWGNEQPNDKLLNYDDNVGSPTAVGSYPNGASPYGVMDMTGNVSEWVSSEQRPYPYNADDGRENYNISGYQYKILRGGEYNENAYGIRSANRGSMFFFNTRGPFIGFRCAK